MGPGLTGAAIIQSHHEEQAKSQAEKNDPEGTEWICNIVWDLVHDWRPPEMDCEDDYTEHLFRYLKREIGKVFGLPADVLGQATRTLDIRDPKGIARSPGLQGMVVGARDCGRLSSTGGAPHVLHSVAIVATHREWRPREFHGIRPFWDAFERYSACSV